MKLSATAVTALSLAFAIPAAAQTTFPDPANLRGERIQPKDGRELPVDQGASGLQQLLRKLNTRASLMLIVAHPDDEDGGMLTFYSRGQGARVATLTLTRGEGGQNAMTGDFEDALGLIRTQELLAADRYFGADQLFGTEVDFGFSKTKEEAFSKWTHQRVLYDAVRAVRLYRPLVLAAVFVGGVTDGHGQHQVSGEIAQEVFKAAADPNVFPELTREGILPWAPLKVYARVPTFAITDKGLFDYATNQYMEPSFTNYVTGQTTSTPPTPDVIVHEGQTDSILTNAAANPVDKRESDPDPNAKLSYVQFARIGLGLQRTQIGPGVRNAPSGAFDVSYHLYGTRLCSAQPAATTTDSLQAPVLSTGAKRSKETCVAPATSVAAHDPQTASFFDGIDTTLDGIASLTPKPPAFLTNALHQLGSTLASAASEFDPAHPDHLAPKLAEALDTTDRLLRQLSAQESREDRFADVDHELQVKHTQINDALALALGLSLDATTHTAQATAGNSVKVLTQLSSSFPHDLEVSAVKLSSPQGNESEPEEAKRRDLPLTTDHTDQRTLTFAAANTLNLTRPYFFRDSVEEPVYKLNNAALRNAPASPPALIAHAEINYRGTKIELGRVVHAGDQPASFDPSISLALSSTAQVIPKNQSTTELTAKVSGPAEVPVSGRLLVTVGPGWIAKPAKLALRVGDTTVTLTAAGAKAATTVTASGLLANGDHVDESFLPVGYPGLVFTNFYKPAKVNLVPIDLKLPAHRRVGYLPGTGDAVADNLRSIGFGVSELKISDLRPEILARFDTVILGVRTYNAHPDLHGAPTQALLDFARKGGNVIVQYQTAEFTAADAPYPLTLGNAEKVVDETDAVVLTEPAAPALTMPNRITSADFSGWIEERGHGFLQTWDSHYTALTETHDPGVSAEHVAPQLPQRGALITTQLGRGHWTYIAFALYRQLPEAVPGAFRLFTNLAGLADQSE